MDAVLGGDREAFRVIVDLAQGPVFRVCLRIMGSTSDAEDAAQETFVTAFRSLATYRGDGPLQAWLVRIATRTAYRRRAARRATDDLRGVDLPTTARADDPVAATLTTERQAAVRLAVAGLDEPYREVVALRYFGELSLEEVAIATGRPVNTIKTQLRRGLQRLAPMLGHEAHP